MKHHKGLDEDFQINISVPFFFSSLKIFFRILSLPERNIQPYKTSVFSNFKLVIDSGRLDNPWFPSKLKLWRYISGQYDYS